ncbi:hypothetical protein L226DRAFT_337307 [Lentinus tigrinus ALCF2SS1-7]|uniref:uncharacterized protein n=1 Tax=Lentinus tigrinus ALCF2SS1-7 TaxID=1328758 RepID=UPI001165E49C|nr:hypothetical protein L226DRAFT_337307 [Lentinus tigrinus ALCF2SS1-7]
MSACKMKGEENKDRGKRIKERHWQVGNASDRAQLEGQKRSAARQLDPKINARRHARVAAQHVTRPRSPPREPGHAWASRPAAVYTTICTKPDSRASEKESVRQTSRRSTHPRWSRPRARILGQRRWRWRTTAVQVLGVATCRWVHVQAAANGIGHEQGRRSAPRVWELYPAQEQGARLGTSRALQEGLCRL